MCETFPTSFCSELRPREVFGLGLAGKPSAPAPESWVLLSPPAPGERRSGSLRKGAAVLTGSGVDATAVGVCVGECECASV